MTESKQSPAHVVDVFDLARTGGSAGGTVAVADLPRLAAAVEPGNARLDYSLTGFIDEQRRPAATLAVRGQVELDCDRCNRPTPVEIDAVAPFFFVASEAELNRIPIDESDEDALVGSPQFDLLALVEDEAILALPVSPRHPDCATPLADVPPAGTDRASPFAELERLKVRKH